MALFLFYWIMVLYWGYCYWNKWLILLLFYGIGFTNPHLSNPMQWFIFVCAYYAFRPNLKNRVYGRK